MSTPTIGELERRIADLEARADEWDEEIGMVDGEPAEEDLVRKDELDAVVDVGDASESPAHTFNCGGYAHVGERVAQVGRLEAFRDGDGDYWLTSPNIRSGLQKGYLLGASADNLRLLADRIEEIEEAER